MEKFVLNSYVPRHIRLGVCCVVPFINDLTSVLEVVPVVDDSGIVLYSENVHKEVSVSELNSKYRLSDFRLSKLQKDGVNLKMVNIDHSSAYTIDELNAISQKISSAEDYVSFVENQRKERDSWFTPIVNVKSQVVE